MTVALTFGCVAALAVLVWSEHAGNVRARYVSKPLASACFIAVAAGGGALDHGVAGYGTWVVIGLILGAGGDVALMFRGRTAFLIGLVLFLLGHLAYVVACSQVLGPAHWLSAWIAVGVAFGGGVLVYLWPHLGSMRIPVITYTVVIMLMLVGAISVWRADAELSARASRLLVIGAGVFAASDVGVARQRFVTESFANRALGLPAYYAGQLCIAWSAIVS